MTTISPAHRAPVAPLSSTRWVFLLLAISMAATRYHHFSNALHLADTSWAVFFLAGLWLRQRWALPALLLLAFGIDLAAVAHDGAAMSACFTPAYPGLILAYGALWLAGRSAAKAAMNASWLTTRLTHLGWATVGILAAFALSNLSFWAFSGHFGGLGLIDYADRVMPYLGRYLQTGLGYVLVAFGVAALLSWLLPSAWFKPVS